MTVNFALCNLFLVQSAVVLLNFRCVALLYFLIKNQQNAAFAPKKAKYFSLSACFFQDETITFAVLILESYVCSS